MACDESLNICLVALATGFGALVTAIVAYIKAHATNKEKEKEELP